MAFTNLVLFAGGPPFRDLHTFLRTEIEYLAAHFQNVYVLVNAEEAPAMDFPENVHLEGITVKLSTPEKQMGVLNAFKKEVTEELLIYQSERVKKINAYKSIFNHYNSAKRYSQKILQFLERQQITIDDGSTLFYSYWTEYRTISMCMLKEQYPKMKLIARMHGWDLYWERHAERYLPFRKLISREADQIYFISENGKRYFEHNAVVKDDDKLRVSYLGSKDFGLNPEDKENKSLKILSCSFSVMLKRVQLIAYALREISNIQIEWTHIGSGPSQEFFEKEVKQSLADKKNIKYRFLGLISNDKVIKHYQEDHFDLFINTSEFEGIPIGMMEAMSFGVPCIGTEIGGVAEIIEDGKNGYLLDPHPLPTEIAKKIRTYHKLEESEKKAFRDNARLTWDEKFNADRNYEQFINDIFALSPN